MKADSTMGTFTAAATVRVFRTMAIAIVPLSLGACEWFTDFKVQPAIEPWEAPSQHPNDTLTPPRGNPQYSVPMQGTLSPAFAVSHAPTLGAIDSMSGIANPVPLEAASVERGRIQYQINCMVCHGPAGAGLATGTIAKVSPQYGISAPLTTDQAKDRTDGYIYGVIRNGRGLMPSYNRIEESERWDIVNYVRALQGKASLAADTTLAGRPGETGTTVPGASFTAPTRPAPYVHPGAKLTPGSSGVNSATFGRENNGASKQGQGH